MPYKNREDRLRRSREYTEENREEINRKHRERTANLTEEEREHRRKTRRKWCEQNREEINLKMKERKAKHREYLVEMLGGKCCGCGTTENLEFDHLDRKTKSFNISSRLASRIEKLEKEAKKCQLLCQSCHQIKTLVNHDCEHMTYGKKIIEVRQEGDKTIVVLAPND